MNRPKKEYGVWHPTDGFYYYDSIERAVSDREDASSEPVMIYEFKPRPLGLYKKVEKVVKVK